MDDRPIGVFDSGLGGLTVVKQLLKTMPEERIVYFGDTGRVPYGTRSRETIIKYTAQDIRFLLKQEVKLIIAACGTVSSVALDALSGRFPVPVIGVVDSAVQAALCQTKSGKIGVLGTAATIKSGSYQSKLRAANPEVQLISRACPLFVPLVENGYYAPDCAIARLAAEEYLAPLMQANVDTIILGCTHYPILKRLIGEIVGEGVRLIDPGKQTAERISRLLPEHQRASAKQPAPHKFYVSDSTEDFEQFCSIFLPQGFTAEAAKIEIEAY